MLVSLARSLPKNPLDCDEYEKELDKYYRIPDLTQEVLEMSENITLYDDFIEKNT